MDSHPPHIDHHKSKHARQVLNKWRQAPWTMARELVVDMIPVVLGILLALGINNWNHARNEHEQEIIYLRQIADDLKADVVEFESDLATYRRFDLAKGFFQTRFSAGSPVDSVRYYLTALYGLTYPIVNKSGFSSLQTSGRLNLLQNKAITAELFELYDTRLASLTLSVDGYADVRKQFILPVLFKLRRADTFRTAQDFAPFINDPYFQNLLGFLFYNEIVGKYERVIKQQKKLITLIDDELHELD